MNTKWQVSQEVLSSKIDDEIILMSIKADAYFGIDPVGSQVWEILSKHPLTTNEIVQLMMEDYEVDEETCRADVQAFIDDMYARKLIEKVD